jgi:hypothetical protein
MLFGGVPTILGGDFVQILLVVARGQRTEIVRACLQRSFIYQHLRRLYLKTNIRVCNSLYDADFVQWISNLLYDPTLNGQVSLLAFVSQPETIEQLIVVG